MTRQECEDKIQRMLLVKAVAVKPELPDYNDIRRYQVLEINLNDGTTVKRLLKTGTNLKIVGKEDLFEELYFLAISKTFCKLPSHFWHAKFILRC